MSVRRNLLGQDMVILPFTNNFSITSTAGGILNSVWNSDPTTGVDWAQFSALYTRYRVLAFEISYCPNVIGATIAAIAYAPIYTVIDNGANTPLTSYAVASAYASNIKFTLNEKWKRVVKMDSVELAAFNSILGSPNSLMQIKEYATGLTVSTNYGQLEENYLIQFQCRQ